MKIYAFQCDVCVLPIYLCNIVVLRKLEYSRSESRKKVSVLTSQNARKISSLGENQLYCRKKVHSNEIGSKQMHNNHCELHAFFYKKQFIRNGRLKFFES